MNTPPAFLAYEHDGHHCGRIRFGEGFPPLPLTCQTCGAEVVALEALDFEWQDANGKAVELLLTGRALGPPTVKSVSPAPTNRTPAGDRWPTIHRYVEGGYVWTECENCRLVDVEVDEDGCCKTCGCDALFYGNAPPEDDWQRVEVGLPPAGGEEAFDVILDSGDRMMARRVGFGEREGVETEAPTHELFPGTRVVLYRPLPPPPAEPVT